MHAIGPSPTIRAAWLATILATPCTPAAGQQLLPLLPGPLPTEYGLLLELPEDEHPRRWWFGAGVDIAHDDNVFRLPSGESTTGIGAAGRPNSSTITRLYGQANLDVSASRQRYLAQFTVSDYRFSGLSYLNYTAPEFRGAWLWQAGERWQGEVNYNHLQSIASFLDTRPFERNLQTLDYASASGEYALTPNWRVGGAVIGYTADNSAEASRAANVRQLTGELGVRYLATDGNYVRGFGAVSGGDYPDRTASALFDDSYSQTDFGVDVLYRVSDISSLRGRLGYTSRESPNVSERDFSGVTGRLDFVWGISPKTSIDFNVRRELGVFETADSSYFVTTAVGIAPQWEVLPKLRLEAAYEHWWREYLGEPATLAGLLPQREDQLNFVRAGAIWTPTRNWLVRLGVQWSNRDSNRSTFDFSGDTVVFGTIQFGF